MRERERQRERERERERERLRARERESESERERERDRDRERERDSRFLLSCATELSEKSSVRLTSERLVLEVELCSASQAGSCSFFFSVLLNT